MFAHRFAIRIVLSGLLALASSDSRADEIVRLNGSWHVKIIDDENIVSIFIHDVNK